MFYDNIEPRANRRITSRLNYPSVQLNPEAMAFQPKAKECTVEEFNKTSQLNPFAKAFIPSYLSGSTSLNDNVNELRPQQKESSIIQQLEINKRGNSTISEFNPLASSFIPGENNYKFTEFNIKMDNVSTTSSLNPTATELIPTQKILRFSKPSEEQLTISTLNPLATEFFPTPKSTSLGEFKSVPDSRASELMPTQRTNSFPEFRIEQGSSSLNPLASEFVPISETGIKALNGIGIVDNNMVTKKHDDDDDDDDDDNNNAIVFVSVYLF